MRRLLGLTIPLVLLAAPAHAERWTADDPVGDVTGWQYSPEPPPCGTFTDVDGTDRANEDITRLTARHSRAVVRVVLGFRDLDAAAEQEVSIHVATPVRGWDLDVLRFERRKGGFRVMTFLAKTPQLPPASEDPDDCGWTGVATVGRPCRLEHSFDFDADLISVTLPRSCVGAPAWVRVGARASGWTYGEDGTFGSFSDEWGDAGNGESDGWVPPLGPEVHAPGH